MTGKEILAAQFEKAGMRGYRADQVDAYLERIAEQVDEQNSKIDDLTYKIQVLAKKIEEYKSDEENIREALLGAQKLGSNILNEAKSKAETITSEAQTAADEMIAQARIKVETITKESLQRATVDLNMLKREYDAEQRSLDLLKNEVSKFKSNIIKQYRSHLAMVMSLPSTETEVHEAENTEAPAEPVQEENVAVNAAEEVATESVEAQPTEPVQEEVVEEPVAAEEEAPKQEESAETVQEEKTGRPNYIEKFGELHFGGFNDAQN